MSLHEAKALAYFTNKQDGSSICPRMNGYVDYTSGTCVPLIDDWQFNVLDMQLPDELCKPTCNVDTETKEVVLQENCPAVQ